MTATRYFKGWSMIKRKAQGPLTEKQANQHHLEGISYSVIPELVSPSTPIITLNSIPGFIGVAWVDHEFRVVRSSSFSRTVEGSPCRLAQVFHFKFRGGDEWSTKTTYSIHDNSRIHREVRTLNPQSSVETEIDGDWDLPQIPFPDFGDLALCYAYEEPDFDALFGDAI